MAGGPTHDVDWTTTPLVGADFSNYHWDLPASTISVLVLQPVPEPGCFAFLSLMTLTVVRPRRRGRLSGHA